MLQQVDALPRQEAPLVESRRFEVRIVARLDAKAEPAVIHAQRLARLRLGEELGVGKWLSSDAVDREPHALAARDVAGCDRPESHLRALKVDDDLRVGKGPPELAERAIELERFDVRGVETKGRGAGVAERGCERPRRGTKRGDE
jgi:hypothetical protein